ncbi:MAG: ABC transporter ATP-binding protein [Burkholderiaceae bacterium]|jgi:putative ABC transport system ATP-binding protein|nr:ABC transporter ATP-binding protein [Burkholderiaceae bacterium]
MIELRHVSKSYRRGDQRVPVLQDLSLKVRSGEFLALMGPSGSGKSTLLNLIAGIDRPDTGEIIIDGRDITRLTESELAGWRSTNVGFIFQFYNLIPVLTAFENVALPLQLISLSEADRKVRVTRALEMVGLLDRMDHTPGELSGGQQQRVAIARALITDPQLIVADEPTGDLDRQSAQDILSMMSRLNRDMGKTILMVTHDPKAAEHAKATVHLEKGQLERDAEHSA